MTDKQSTTRPTQNGSSSQPFAMSRQEPTSQLAKFDPSDLMPRSWAEARELAMFLSQAGMLPDHLKGQPHNVFLTILSGLELGVSPLVACREIYFVKGRPNISSRMKVAMVRGSPVCRDYEEVESTDKRAIVRARRVGQEKWTTKEFTIEDAKRADLFKNDVWNKYPKDMLLHRANSRLCDDLFQDVTRGMRTREEVQDEEKEVDGERLTPPPNPSTYAAPAQEAPAQEEVDPNTGEVIPAAEPVDELSFDTLSTTIRNAPTREQLLSVALRINDAKSKGKLNAEQEAELRKLYKARNESLPKDGAK